MPRVSCGTCVTSLLTPSIRISGKSYSIVSTMQVKYSVGFIYWIYVPQPSWNYKLSGTWYIPMPNFQKWHEDEFIYLLNCLEFPSWYVQEYCTFWHFQGSVLYFNTFLVPKSVRFSALDLFSTNLYLVPALIWFYRYI